MTRNMVAVGVMILGLFMIGLGLNVFYDTGVALREMISVERVIK